MEFWADFGAEDEARLMPCKDDKPKDAEITLFKAGSDYFLSAKHTRVESVQIYKFKAYGVRLPCA